MNLLEQMAISETHRALMGTVVERISSAESRLHALLIRTRGISVSMKEDNRGEESKIPTPQGRKRTASKDLETKVSKRGKKPSPGGPTPEGILTAQCPQGDQPSTEL